MIIICAGWVDQRLDQSWGAFSIWHTDIPLVQCMSLSSIPAASFRCRLCGGAVDVADLYHHKEHGFFIFAASLDLIC